ncbi:ABC transporter substrate-binding protein [Roseomonas sp. GC11]|uniref:ABC transporter substrate-binding protein n=1 Tax=Roseomonas sp. GC11 TaxID=2950546 RepID=UPI00210A3CB0|nr:ABC transporter substrate-binding protein [Roseomonas sp. GC11]MCQ4159087.1 ABC transporter substrate-binding protein [Roseomonas sp. GC11]
MNRRSLMLSALAGTLPALPGLPAQAAGPGGVLRLATTLADLPLTTGQASQGAEGQRFIGMTLYDGLLNWDLSRGDTAAQVGPGLAQDWSVDAEDRRRWTFRLRPGVRFHDGSPVTAEDIAWNFDKLLKRDAPQFDPQQAAQGAPYTASLASYRALDALTLEIVTKQPDAVLPYQLAMIAISGPRRWEEMGRDWSKVAQRPSGTGPWMLERLVPRERAELVPNPAYWNPQRVPRLARLVLLTVPDANTRVSALLSGQADWIEAPPPDAVPQLRAAGMQIVTNLYPHVWPYQLSTLPDAPTRDVRVRQALNLAIDREGLCQMLGGLAVPAEGMVNRGHPWFGEPAFRLRHDPEAARALLRQAGYGPGNPVRLKVIISPSGSGQMQPQPMNEFIQESLRAVGVELTFEVMEWEALRGRRRMGAAAPENRGISGINNSWGFWDPDIALLRVAASADRPPAGYNWGGWQDEEADRLVAAARTAFTRAEQDRLLAALHTRIVDQALWLWVVHDLNPRAMSPKVQGFVQAQSWFQDLTPVRIG